MDHDRRQFLAMTLAAPVVLATATRALAAEACFDPEALPLAQQGMRRSLQYVEPSPDAAKRCDLCAFFAGTKAGCGNCQILGGPVSGGAVCASFAARPKK